MHGRMHGPIFAGVALKGCAFEATRDCVVSRISNHVPYRRLKEMQTRTNSLRRNKDRTKVSWHACQGTT